ncbi:MAG: transketolase [Parcubacteria group bacterium Gr01-1014_31]|nr:MAG: transketolase [Parcubacteria group bacterium Gr01-1014_31]
MAKDSLRQLTQLVRYYILKSTTAAGSGHPSSSLSAVELTVGLLFSGVFRFDADHPARPNNDRLIFSKGHASPLLYALWAAAGRVSENELVTLRKFGSVLEGHPVPAFPFAEAATGSLGQGLSIGVGMAYNAKYFDQLPYRTYVLLGDSEMAEGSIWEAIQLAAHYQLDNLVGILDVNRLGQTGPTMYGHDVKAYAKRVESFGWKCIVVNGHSLPKVIAAYRAAARVKGKPVMVVAKTMKGRGVSLLENKPGWHGKALSQDELKGALAELGPVDASVRGQIALPEEQRPRSFVVGVSKAPSYPAGKPVATREAYGHALVRLAPLFPSLVAMDGETSNSTFAEKMRQVYPERYVEMYIAEQNMVGAALGMARRGKIPFVSTFAAFFTRAFDQIRMSQYSGGNIKFCGSHAGVSIGQDGPSQMGLEDLAMFRTVLNSVVLYPCDAYSTEALVEEAVKHRGIVYVRTTRMATPLLYSPGEKLAIGGSKVLRATAADQVAIVGAGVTVFEALKAADQLKEQGIDARVIDCYSVKPVDRATLQRAAHDTKAIITVEDHVAEGGIGDAVREAVAEIPVRVYSLAVRKQPKSGTPQELLDYEEISAPAIVEMVKKIL